MYSIVTIIFNERDSINQLYHELKNVFAATGENYEIIFVNDGSSDGSIDNLELIAKKDKSIKIINSSMRRGQTFALRDGLNIAEGEIIITLDSDLQNVPSDIPLLIEKINEGYDLVCGWRYERQDPLFKKAFSRIGNFIMYKFLKYKYKVEIHDIACTLKAYRRYCLKELNLHRDGYHRFIPFILVAKNFKITEIYVHHRARKFGVSKYNLIYKLIKVPYDFLMLLYELKNSRIRINS